VHTVDERLVGLGQQRDPAALEALHEVDLPQRPAAVERARDDARHELEQLRRRTGARQRRAAHVEADVEVLVVDPHRVGEVAGHRLQPLAVARHERDPVTDQLDQPGVVERPLPLARVEDLDRGVVERRLRRLLRQERQVARTHPIHHVVLQPVGDPRGTSGDRPHPAALGSA